MPFWRSWAAAMLGASGAAVAVPVGLVLTVTVAAGVSGGGFGGLAQLTRGPELPGVWGQQARKAAPLDAGLPNLPRGTATTALRAATGTTRATGRRTSTRRTHKVTTTAPTTVTPTQTPLTPTTTEQTPGPTTPTTTTPPAVVPTTPAPTTRPNPLRELVRTVQGVVTTLPAIGKPVADAVGSVADLILPPLPRAVPAVVPPPAP